MAYLVFGIDFILELKNGMLRRPNTKYQIPRLTGRRIIEIYALYMGFQRFFYVFEDIRLLQYLLNDLND